MATTVPVPASISPWWKRTLGIVMVLGFSLLVLLSYKAYEAAPPIPARVVDAQQNPLFTRQDVQAGQQVFLKYGLMDNGTVWGHGGMLGPDFSATTLHRLALAQAGAFARKQFGRPYEELEGPERSAVDGMVAATFKHNDYDASSDVLHFPQGAEALAALQAYWTDYFREPASNGGLTRQAIRDPEALRQLTAFFAWTAWASAARRPGETYSYTNNFPYDPLVGNSPTSGALLWSALSFLFLLGGTAVVLLAFGKFDYLGWHGPDEDHAPLIGASPGGITPAQAATLKLMLLACLLFVAQVLIGGAVAHYRAEPGNFYGLDLAALLPSNLLRAWHLQLAIFWVATAFVGGALFVSGALAGRDPKHQVTFINLLFGALVIVVVGSLLGQWAGINDLTGQLWYWLGNQGWEYLEIGRFWQILLTIGLSFWFWLIWRALAPARSDPVKHPFINFFLVASFAIPFFYLPAFFFDSKSHFSVVDVWRFWLIHLWVEGFFEFFITVIVAVIFCQLRLVSRLTALRVIYLDAILYFGGGLLGTAHHWYFTGQSELAMALGATVSALEVVPLTLLTLDAWDFYRVTRQEGPAYRHRWTFYFLMAVGFWNFTGAGVFGFLVNTPIVSYYEAGTGLTLNHAHAAFAGVFGMLSVGLMVYVLREVVSDAHWVRIERYVRVSFWSLNIGLMLMLVLSLFPGGVLQLHDVLINGYWHARSLDYTATRLSRFIEWMRMWGDMIFIFGGAIPMAWALWRGYLSSRREHALAPASAARSTSDS